MSGVRSPGRRAEAPGDPLHNTNQIGRFDSCHSLSCRPCVCVLFWRLRSQPLFGRQSRSPTYHHYHHHHLISLILSILVVPRESFVAFAVLSSSSIFSPETITMADALQNMFGGDLQPITKKKTKQRVGPSSMGGILGFLDQPNNEENHFPNPQQQQQSRRPAKRNRHPQRPQLRTALQPRHQSTHPQRNHDPNHKNKPKPIRHSKRKPIDQTTVVPCSLVEHSSSCWEEQEQAERDLRHSLRRLSLHANNPKDHVDDETTTRDKDDHHQDNKVSVLVLPSTKPQQQQGNQQEATAFSRKLDHPRDHHPTSTEFHPAMGGVLAGVVEPPQHPVDNPRHPTTNTTFPTDLRMKNPTRKRSTTTTIMAVGAGTTTTVKDSPIHPEHADHNTPSTTTTTTTTTTPAKNDDTVRATRGFSSTLLFSSPASNMPGGGSQPRRKRPDLRPTPYRMDLEEHHSVDPSLEEEDGGLSDHHHDSPTMENTKAAIPMELPSQDNDDMVQRTLVFPPTEETATAASHVVHARRTIAQVQEIVSTHKQDPSPSQPRPVEVTTVSGPKPDPPSPLLRGIYLPMSTTTTDQHHTVKPDPPCVAAGTASSHATDAVAASTPIPNRQNQPEVAVHRWQGPRDPTPCKQEVLRSFVVVSKREAPIVSCDTRGVPHEQAHHPQDPPLVSTTPSPPLQSRSSPQPSRPTVDLGNEVERTLVPPEDATVEVEYNVISSTDDGAKNQPSATQNSCDSHHAETDMDQTTVDRVSSAVEAAPNLLDGEGSERGKKNSSQVNSIDEMDNLQNDRAVTTIDVQEMDTDDNCDPPPLDSKSVSEEENDEEPIVEKPNTRQVEHGGRRRTRKQPSRFGSYATEEEIERKLRRKKKAPLAKANPKASKGKGGSEKLVKATRICATRDSASRTRSDKEHQHTSEMDQVTSKNETIAMSTNNQSSSEDEETGEQDEWSDAEIEALRRAQATVDPRSSFYWDRVAGFLTDRTAEECNSKWFSLVATPKCPRVNHNDKEGSRAEPRPTSKEDDMFDSSPQSSGDWKAAINETMDLGSPIVLDVAEPVTRPGDSALNPKAGYKSYIARLTREMNKDKRGKPKGRKQRPTPSVGPTSKTCSQSVHQEDYELKARMTPGGTLTVRQIGSPEEEDDDDEEFYEDYEE